MAEKMCFEMNRLFRSKVAISPESSMDDGKIMNLLTESHYKNQTCSTPGLSDLNRERVSTCSGTRQ